MNPLVAAIKQLGDFIGMKLDGVKDAIIGQKVSVFDLNDGSKTLTAAQQLEDASKVLLANEKGRDLTGLQVALMKASGELQDTAQVMRNALGTFNSAELKQMNAALANIQKATLANKPKEVNIDLTPLSKRLEAVQNGIDALGKALQGMDNAPVIMGLGKLTDAINSIQLSSPSTIKLDEMQMKQIALRGGGGMSVAGGIDLATTPTIARKTLTSANTEYTYTFPRGTVSFYIKTVDQNVKLLYSWTTGTLPTSGDGTAYFTTPQNFVASRERAAFGGKTIYLQCATAGEVVEIESYSM